MSGQARSEVGWRGCKGDPENAARLPAAKWYIERSKAQRSVSGLAAEFIPTVFEKAREGA